MSISDAQFLAADVATNGNTDAMSLSETSLDTPLSSDEMIEEEDVRNLHDIIWEGHLEEEELQEEEHSRFGTYGHQTTYSFSLWGVLRKGAINLVLPFINGIMLGFGEILAHEIGFRYGLVGARVYPPRRIEQRQKSKFL